MWQDLLSLDRDLFLQLNGLHSKTMDQVMLLCSAKWTWVPLYALFLFLILKQWRLRGLLISIPLIALMIALSDAGSVHFFKERFTRLRPCHVPELQGLVHTVNAYCGGTYGFISSHAANHFAIAFFTLGVLRNLPKWAKGTILFWAVAVAYSRIYLGVHYPGDVLIGALYGTLIGASIAWLFRYLMKRFKFTPD